MSTDVAHSKAQALLQLRGIPGKVAHPIQVLGRGSPLAKGSVIIYAVDALLGHA